MESKTGLEQALDQIAAAPQSYAVLDLDVAVFSKQARENGSDVKQATEQLLEVFCGEKKEHKDLKMCL